MKILQEFDELTTEKAYLSDKNLLINYTYPESRFELDPIKVKQFIKNKIKEIVSSVPSERNINDNWLGNGEWYIELKKIEKWRDDILESL